MSERPEAAARGLSTGERFGRFRILGRLGAGGMGEVYAAADEKLGREVALKVLPAAVSGHPEQRARFEREARAVAALNHPNIVTIHAVEEIDGQLALVMERVRGRSLDALLPAGGFPLPRLLEIAIPLADAVSAAHVQGITHRDLKPANVMIGDDRRLRVLDFGIAKVGAAPADGPTATETAEGTVLGTVAYMSPQQAQGRRVDPSSDVFSLGVMLFELATGRRPFGGASPFDVAAAILKDEAPAPSSLAPALPPAFDRIVRRCLEKDSTRRYQTALDLRNDLEELRDRLGDAPTGAIPAASPAPAPPSGRRRAALTGLLALMVLALGALELRHLRPAGPAPPPVRPAPPIERLRQLTSQLGGEWSPSLSPDGSSFVYAHLSDGNWDVFRQRVGGENPMNLTAGSTADDQFPVFSPDGERIAFCSNRQGAGAFGAGGLYVMGATGESVRHLGDACSNPSWSPDGAHLAVAVFPVFNLRNLLDAALPLFVVDVASGAQRKLVDDGLQPAWSPHGHRIAFVRAHQGRRELWTVPAAGGEPQRLSEGTASHIGPAWSPDGQYLYYSSDAAGNLDLWRRPIDEEGGRARGPAERITTGAGAWAHSIAFSRDGARAIFVADQSRTVLDRQAIDPQRGAFEGVPVHVALGDQADERHGLIAFRVATGGQDDIAVVQADGRGWHRVTDDEFADGHPSWSPDGREIAFHSNRSGTSELWAVHPDGSGLRQLTAFKAPVLVGPFPWSPDGTVIAVAVAGRGLLAVDPRVAPEQQTGRVLYRSRENGFFPGAWSPDGRTLFGTVVDRRGTLDHIAALDPATGEATRVAIPGSQPFCLGDCRRLLHARGENELWISERATGQGHQVLLDRTRELAFFRGGEEGRSVLLTRVTSDADLWLATFP